MVFSSRFGWVQAGLPGQSGWVDWVVLSPGQYNIGIQSSCSSSRWTHRNLGSALKAWNALHLYVKNRGIISKKTPAQIYPTASDLCQMLFHYLRANLVLRLLSRFSFSVVGRRL